MYTQYLQQLLYIIYFFSVGGWRIRHGTELCHTGCTEYTAHVRIARSLSTKFAGRSFLHNIKYLIFHAKQIIYYVFERPNSYVVTWQCSRCQRWQLSVFVVWDQNISLYNSSFSVLECERISENSYVIYSYRRT